jgi:DNA-directed RNA polymerase specialized sigma subunit|tara:strand:+ start:1778 stop:2293 length:516 start_codon:yes stop_codon:yes gene_type:complete
MKLPKGMTEKQTIEQINKVCNRIAPKYTFYGYTADDMKQEAFIICVEALNRYDEARPLENFLSVNLSNRLKNFVRDNHFIKNDDGDRIKVLKPAQLEYENTIVDDRKKFSITYSQIQDRDMFEVIDKNLPAQARMDYLKILNDVYITKQRKEEILFMIYDILEEHGYCEEG